MLLLRREYDRFKTFCNLGLDEKKAIKLARSGFFYTNINDKIKCYFCSIEMNAFTCPSDVEAEHLRLSPNCIYANGKDECGLFMSPTNKSTFSICMLKSLKLVGSAIILSAFCCEVYHLYKFFAMSN